MAEKETKVTETKETKETKKVKKERKYKLPNPKKKMLSYKFLQLFIRLKAKKPEIINLAGGEIEDKSIVVINHSNKSGPASIDLRFPKKTVKWGAHQMLDYYPERKAYLRDILYIKKNGKKPGFWTSFKSSIEAMLNLWPYKGIWVIPTYQDARFIKTIRYSMEMLDKNVPVMVFPEDSNNGYFEVLTKFFPGFVVLAETYYKKYGVDLPVYPCYYHIPKRKMVIGKPIYVQDLVKQGMNREQIAQHYCDAVNNLFFEYIADKTETPAVEGETAETKTEEKEA